MMFGNRRDFNELLANSDEGIASNILADPLSWKPELGERLQLTRLAV
jgi:hypothetical protein